MLPLAAYPTSPLPQVHMSISSSRSASWLHRDPRISWTVPSRCHCPPETRRRPETWLPGLASVCAQVAHGSRSPRDRRALPSDARSVMESHSL
eukprot:690992-Pyramimonas_sp.AAC.1